MKTKKVKKQQLPKYWEPIDKSLSHIEQVKKYGWKRLMEEKRLTDEA